MDIPFKLNIFKQIELYQELQDLERQFADQLKDSREVKMNGNGYVKNPPTWFFEKKILRWTWTKHKHLGSPLKIKDFVIDDNSVVDSNISQDEAIQNAISTSIKEAEGEYERFFNEVNITKKEISSIQIRKVFGNLEVKGFARFFKMNESNYWNINQANCDGIFFTKRGLEYAKMIYYLYAYKDATENYKKIKGVERILECKKSKRLRFDIYIIIARAVIIGALFLFFKAVIEGILDLFV